MLKSKHFRNIILNKPIVLMNQEEREYEPDDAETLIAAFKVLS